MTFPSTEALPEGGKLVFCGHHTMVNQRRLEKEGATIRPESPMWWAGRRMAGDEPDEPTPAPTTPDAFDHVSEPVSG